MECLRAQELVSDALDGLPVEAGELALAKTHCRECDNCGAFVRAQLAVRDAGLPEPPPDLADRVMAGVRAEAARAATRKSASEPTTVPATGPAVVPPQTELPDGARPAQTWSELGRRAWHPRNRRAVIAWASAAAVLFIAAGIGALAGVRAILLPTVPAETTVVGSVKSEEQLDYSTSGAPTSTNDRSAQESAAATQASAASFITVNEVVYRLSGSPTGVDDRALEKVGTTRTSLDTGGREVTYDVMGTDDATVIYLEVERDEWRSFERVTRTYGDSVYALHSQEITAFGAWPALPNGIREPSSEDGSPTFEPDGVDSAGTPIFRQRGSDAGTGIGVGPNPPAGDPLAGSPSWSWWEPAE